MSYSFHPIPEIASIRQPLENSSFLIDDYSKDGGSGVLCSFYHEPLRSLIDLLKKFSYFAI